VLLKKRPHGRLVADVKVVMLVVPDSPDQLLPVGERGGASAEKPAPQIIVNADNLEALASKVFDAFGPDQSRRAGDNDCFHKFSRVAAGFKYPGEMGLPSACSWSKSRTQCGL